MEKLMGFLRLTLAAEFWHFEGRVPLVRLF